MERFGWPVRDLIKKKKLLIIQPELYKYDVLLNEIENAIDKIKAKRLVIDSLTIIGMYFEDPYKVRRAVFEISRTFKRLGCTILAITEIAEGSESLSPFGVEEYVADGVIVLYYTKRDNSFLRAVAVRKMRFTDHSNKLHPLKIGSEGIIVFGTEEIFATI